MITLPIWLAVLIIMAAACIGFLFASMCKGGDCMCTFGPGNDGNDTDTTEVEADVDSSYEGAEGDGGIYAGGLPMGD